MINMIDIFKDLLSKAPHHGELSIAKPHHPTGSVCSTTAAAHPPGNDPAGPPGETSQLPKHQGANDKPPAIL